MIIRKKSHPRAALVGNPSDGSFGKTIAFVFKDFSAEVVLYETPEVAILPNHRDHSVFPCIDQLVKDVLMYGYYGGIRLLKATIKRFHDYCRSHNIALHDKNFTLRYSSDIPHQVGLAGSSAIVTACMRTLCEFYCVEIPNPTLANLALSVENEELGISAGLQDRVALAYGGVVYMDFDKETMARQGYGHYEPIDPGILPPLYLAYDASLAERSDVFHNNIRERFDRGEKEVVAAMRFWADLTDQVRDCLGGKADPGKIGQLINANFDKRREIYQVSDRNIAMVNAARAAGASAKFSGSGGAIVGTYEDEQMFQRLQESFEPMNIKVFKPQIV